MVEILLDLPGRAVVDSAGFSVQEAISGGVVVDPVRRQFQNE
ncbi:MAG TPA: hypothetical protein VI756_15290 [Blastocatellia bacterium]